MKSSISRSGPGFLLASRLKARLQVSISAENSIVARKGEFALSTVEARAVCSSARL